MKAKLLFFEDNYYLILLSGETRHLSVSEVRNFLKNYDTFIESIIFDTTSFVNKDISNGMMMAVLEDNGELHICNSNLLKTVFDGDVSSYLTTEEFAEKHNRNKSLVLRLCRQGRIEGAIQKGSMWLIPEDAQYPADARVGARVNITPQKIIRK